MIFFLIQLKGFPFYWRRNSKYNYYKLLLHRTYNRIGKVLVSMNEYGQMRIRIRRIRMFLGLLDPDLLVRGMALDPAPEPNPYIIKQKYYTIVRKTLIPTVVPSKIITLF